MWVGAKRGNQVMSQLNPLKWGKILAIQKRTPYGQGSKPVGTPCFHNQTVGKAGCSSNGKKIKIYVTQLGMETGLLIDN